jgi:predicted outer membrane repeat protein
VCEFSGNSCRQGRGGAIYAENGEAVLMHCDFDINSAALTGGGIHNETGAPQLTRVRFRGNTAPQGGGMYSLLGEPTLINCLFSGNIATGDEEETFDACVIEGRGGGYASIVGNSTFVNCTFVNNRAECNGLGGGVEGVFGSFTNCIFWDNLDSEGDGESAQIRGGNPIVNFSCVDGLTGDLGGAGNIGGDPLFADADGPDDQPGTPDDDLRLLAGSPCIDAGDNTAVPEGIDSDLLGQPRFVDDPETPDSGIGTPPIVDMGAIEYQAITCPADLDGSGVVDVADLLMLLGQWNATGGVADLNGDGIVDVADLLVLLAAWGPCP